MDPKSWLGELSWQGYPRLGSVADAKPAPKPADPVEDGRLAALARDNEQLRAKLSEMAKLAREFERRFNEAGAAYESALQETENRLRAAALERERLSGELDALKAEAARAAARESGRETELRLERERKTELERALLDARRRLEELTAEAESLRAQASKQEGAMDELRRQADGQSERLLQAKALTDQDVQLLRQEMREFIAKFHRIKESSGEKE